jgi:hypothetical protein
MVISTPVFSGRAVPMIESVFLSAMNNVSPTIAMPEISALARSPPENWSVMTPVDGSILEIVFHAGPLKLEEPTEISFLLSVKAESVAYSNAEKDFISVNEPENWEIPDISGPPNVSPIIFMY